MSSRLNRLENEGLVVIGRAVTNDWASADAIRAAAEAVDAWGQKLSLPLGLVYCGTTINWPDGYQYTPVLIGLVTFSGFGDDEEPIAGEVPPESMDIARASAIPEELWRSLEEQHGVELGDLDVYLAAAGWTWTRLEMADGGTVCGVSTEDDGYRAIPEEGRSEHCVMSVGYC
jgi:hypothetical protein